MKDAGSSMSMQEMWETARHLVVDFLPMKSFAENPLIFSEGKGIYVTTVDGQRFIDGLSGAFAVNLGYGNERLAEAAARPATEHSNSPSSCSTSRRRSTRQ
jgi:adenosylmethionine-8-amino-7-oxononanoate aminotransferase